MKFLMDMPLSPKTFQFLKNIGVKILASISRDKVTVDKNSLRRASELEKVGLKALDALHLACVEKSAEVMLTTDG